MKLVQNPTLKQPTFTCLRSTMKTPELCVISIQSSEAYLQPSLKF